MTVGSIKTAQEGQRDVFGGKLFAVSDYAGPTSYNNTGTPQTSGDAISSTMFGFPNTILCFIEESADQTGTYYVLAQPINNGLTAWRLRWFTTAGTEVSNGVNLSTYIVKLAVLGY